MGREAGLHRHDRGEQQAVDVMALGGKGDRRAVGHPVEEAALRAGGIRVGSGRKSGLKEAHGTAVGEAGSLSREILGAENVKAGESRGASRGHPMGDFLGSECAGLLGGEIVGSGNGGIGRCGVKRDHQELNGREGEER